MTAFGGGADASDGRGPEEPGWAAAAESATVAEAVEADPVAAGCGEAVAALRVGVEGFVVAHPAG